MTTDVIICALNEQETIGTIIGTFYEHPAIGNVHVMVDDNSQDLTMSIVRKLACNVDSVHLWRLVGVSGKGQLVNYARNMIDTPRVILCDADYTKFNSHCINMVLTYSPLMRVVVPRFPTQKEWAKDGLPEIPLNYMHWAVNSGFRSLPTELLHGTEFHGYLLETQLNQIAYEKKVSIDHVDLSDLIAPLRFTPERMKAMEADRQWGMENGIFSN